MRTDFTVSPTYLAGVVESAMPPEWEAGLSWYEREGEWVRSLAHVYETTPEQVAAITGILSAQAAWDTTGTIHPNQHTNKVTVVTVLDLLCDDPEGLATASIYATQRQRHKCRMVYEDPAFRLTPELGPKVFPFACNLTGDWQQVTIDQFAWGATIGWFGPMRRLPQITPRRRTLAEAAYLWLAERLAVTPAQAQALVWVVYRRLRKELIGGSGAPLLLPSD